MRQQTLSPSNASCCLNAGQSPAAWQRDLSRKTDRLSSLPRACSWLDLTKVRVKLKQQPLLGTCLPEVVGQGEPPATPNASKSQPHKLPSNLPHLPQQTLPDRAQGTLPCSPALPQLKVPAKGKRSASDCHTLLQPETPSQSQQSVPCEKQPLSTPRQPAVEEASLCQASPSRLEPKASSELLYRLADKSVTKAFSHPPNKPTQQSDCKPDELQPSNRDRSNHQLAKRSPTRIAVPPVQQNSQSHHNWLHTIAQRTQHSLHQQLERLHQKSHLLASSQNILVNQWSIPVNGESISLEALTHWSSQTITTRDENIADKSSPSTTPNQSLFKFSDFSPALPSATQFSQDLEQSITRSPRSIPQSDNPLISQPLSSTPVTESSLDTLQSPTLPSLTPAQTVDQPTPNLAAAIVQTAKPEPAPETDLNLLATHIKRILDDEARRYGINV